MKQKNNKIGMKFRSTIVSVLLLSSMVLAFFTPIGLAYDTQAGESVFGLIPSSYDVEVGDTFYLNVFVDGNASQPAYGWKIENLTFNYERVGMCNATEMNILSYGYWTQSPNIGTINNNSGYIWNSWATETPTKSTSDNVTGARINFTAISCGTVYFNMTGASTKMYDSLGSAWPGVLWHNTTVNIHPADPASLVATRYNYTGINLTFTPGAGGSNTTVCGKTGSYPTDPTDGVIYNGSGNFYNWSGRTPCTKYWFRAWTWNETEQLHSVTYQQDYATTQCHTNFTFSGEIPVDASTTADGTYSIPVNVTVTNSAGNTFSVWINTTNGDSKHYGPGLTNGSSGFTMTGLAHNTLYYWNVTAYDAFGDVAYDNYTFTTGTGGGSAPSPPVTPNPANHAPSIPINIGLFSVVVSDPDGDAINTTFKWINGTVIGYDDTTASGGTASITPTLNLDYDTTYRWYAIASDGILTKQSATWDFTTDEISVAMTKEWTAYENNSVKVWLNITNNGQTNLTSVIITETYDTNLEFVSSNPTNDSGLDNRWTIPYLNMTGHPGHWYNITLWLNLTGALTNGDTIGNSVKSSVLGVDNTTVVATGDKLTVGLTVTKEANETYWDANNTYTYWINVTNTGDFTLYNVWINETYDADCTYVSNSSVPVANTNVSNNSWMWTNLTPGGTIKVTVVVNATGSNSSLVSNVVDVETRGGVTAQATLNNYIGVATTRLKITYTTPLGALLSGSYTALLLIIVLGIVLAAVALMYVIIRIRKQGE